MLKLGFVGFLDGFWQFRVVRPTLAKQIESIVVATAVLKKFFSFALLKKLTGRDSVDVGNVCEELILWESAIRVSKADLWNSLCVLILRI